jgi:hypothetical protein
MRPKRRRDYTGFGRWQNEPSNDQISRGKEHFSCLPQPAALPIVAQGNVHQILREQPSLKKVINKHFIAKWEPSQFMANIKNGEKYFIISVMFLCSEHVGQ